MVAATEVLFASSTLVHCVVAHLSPGDLPVDAQSQPLLFRFRLRYLAGS